MSKNRRDIVTVYHGTLTEAALLKSFLQSEGIPCFLKDELESRASFFVNDGFSGVKIVVSSENEIEARLLIKEFKGNR